MYKLLITLLLVLFACTGLKETMHKENPDFISKAYHYKITSPLSHDNPLFHRYAIEDPLTKDKHEFEVKFDDKESKYYEMPEEAGSDNFHETKEVISHRFSFVNPLDGKKFTVTGKTMTIHSKEGADKVVTGASEYDFHIYSCDREIGIVNTGMPIPTSIYEIIYPVEISLNDKKIYGKYQPLMNNKTISFTDDEGLIALFGFESDGFVANKFKGDAYIKQELPEKDKTDIIAMFIITDTVISINGTIYIR